jgi:hypothetical protein
VAFVAGAGEAMAAARERAAEADGRDPDPPVELTCEMPVPGTLSVRVTRPEVFAEIRAPFTPALRPMLLGVTVIRTPGAILNDLRTLNPITTPIGLYLHGCLTQPGSV